MIEFELPETISEDFMALIPQQRLYIENLMADGAIKSYSLSLDRSRLWTVMAVDNEFAVLEIIEAMPLSDYMKPNISELMFHNEAEKMIPFSLN